MKTILGNLVDIALITVPVISILSNIEENREGINNLYALGSLIVIVILFKYGVRSVKRKKVLGWIMIAAAIALFFYTDSKSSLFYSIMVGTVEALFVLLQTLPVLTATRSTPSPTDGSVSVAVIDPLSSAPSSIA